MLLGILGAFGCAGGDAATPTDLDITVAESAAPTCLPPAEDQAAVTRTYLATLFPDSATDKPIACKINSANCSQRFTHKSAAPTGTVPAIAGCKSGEQPLGACYTAAVQVTLAALNAGDAAKLYEGAVRTRDITLRAANDDSSPSWLRNFGAANVLARTYIDAGIPVNAPLANCVTGTTDQRYVCLANGNRAHYRGLLGLLERHLGILLRTGTAADLVGASERMWSIVKSATAPVHAKIVASGKIEPKAGIRMNRIDLLAKHSVLRQLDGSTAGTVDTHLANLVTRKTYVPASPGAVGPLLVPRFDILLAAGASFSWDDVRNRPIDADPIGADDVRALHRTLTHGITLSTLQGQCVRAQQFQDIRVASSALFAPKKFIELEGMASSAFTSMDGSLSEVLVDIAIAQGRSCGWITSEDYVYGWTETVTWYEYDAWDDCEEGTPVPNGGVVTDCERCEDDGDVINGAECECHWHTYDTGASEYSFEDCNYIVEIEYSEDYQEEGRVADAYTFVQSLREAYRELMVGYDAFEKVNGRWVKRQGNNADGILDLHYVESDSDATIALAYVDGEQCDEEVASVSATYGDVPTLDCAPGDVCGVAGSEWFPLGAWIPFPIASRVCPIAAGTFAGVLADDGNESWCATPWDYTKAVAHDWLPYAESIIAAIGEEDMLDGYETAGDTWQAEDGENLESVLVEFFAEAGIHGTTAAAAYLREAQVAYTAGKLPTLDADAALAGETLGLENVEDSVDAGLDVLALTSELQLDFHEMEDDVSEDSTAVSMYYDRPIPKLVLGAMEDLDGGIVTNDYTSNKAMAYARLGDQLDLHRQLVRMKLEILWRKADGFGACTDTGVCDPFAGPSCTSNCARFEDVLELVDETSAELDELDDMLADHAGWMLQDCPFAANPAPLARVVAGAVMDCADDPQGLLEYIGRLREHIAGTKDELARSAASMQAGNDAFGFRGMNHYPGDAIDTRIGELVENVRTMGTEYEDFIDSYLGTLADYSQFESAVDAAANNASVLLASYCVDEDGVEEPTGCAVDASTWTTSTPLAGLVNEIIEETFCAGRLVDPETGAEITVMPDYLDDNGEADLFQIYSDYMTSLGLATDTCPQIAAPDFGEWEGYGGALAADLSAMQNILEQLSQQLTTFRSTLYAQATMAEAIAVIQGRIDGTTDAISRAQTLQGTLACAVAATVAVGVGTSAFPELAGAALPAMTGAIGACSNMMFTIAGGALGDTLEELQMQLATLYFDYAALQNLLAIAGDIHGTLLQYEAAVRSFDAHRAELQNASNSVTAEFRDLFTNAFAFDPTNLLFHDEQVANMALNFDAAMRDVRELEILVGYDLGAPLSEKKGIYIEDGYYFLPRLADVTVAESYGGTGLKAYAQLAGSTQPTDERNMNLVAIATLLGAIHDAAETLSAAPPPPASSERERWSAHGFLSEETGSGFDASGYPESEMESMLLRSSPFFNAWVASDLTHDDAGDGGGVEADACDVGFVDLYDYCKDADGNATVPENTCLDVRTLPEVIRLNLAWTDLEIVGIGARNFTCTETAGVHSIVPAVGANGVYLDIEELNPTEVRNGVGDTDWYLPDFMEKGTLGAGDSWYRGISQDFYDSQSPTVRRLMTAVLDMADRGVVEITRNAFMPGSYLLAIHPTDTENYNAVWDPVTNNFDLEYWALVDTGVGSENTFAERLEDISVLCTDSSTCLGIDRNGGNAVESHHARFFYSGPGQQSTVCSGSESQEKRDWVVDDRSTMGQFAIRSTNASLHLSDAEWMSARVADPTASVKAGDLAEVPLQATLAIVQVFGLTDADGVEEPQPWVFQGDPPAVAGGAVADEVPNLRVAFRYRYYSTALATDADWSVQEGRDFYESVTSCTGANTYPWN
jgi:hypothetical protein